MTWVGVDDTDSPKGGCTTFTLTEVIRAGVDAGFDLIGEPRLVRLNPNVPFKTRGNAALAARFGHGAGRRRRVGVFPAGPVWSYSRGGALAPAEVDRLEELAWSAVRASASLGERGTDPAMIVTDRALPPSLYWEAVQRLVAWRPVTELLERLGARHRTLGEPGGVVGAAAALAWPGLHPTWELLAYRPAYRRGAPRRVDPDSVREVERRFPELFLCTDRATRRTLVVPHTACPILFGLRATRPDRLPRAARGLRTEPVDRWLLFRTNQATGDHLCRRAVRDLDPFSSAVLTGTVAAPPEVRRGGHVAFRLRDSAGDEVECWAFEPTKTLPRLASRLLPGDRMRAWGGVGALPPFRLEGIELLRVAPRRVAAPNPRCPACGRRMGSLGLGRGFRCAVDRTRAPPEGRSFLRGPPGPALGRYHPTPSARRHLHPRAPEGLRGAETALRWWMRRRRTDLYG